MQKKSLLVALFCGALCLTGCLKNEESASVAQVRIAKANELNSIADLNKAKAAAEAVYAQAELVVAQAEAKLREANAALVLAQAETEKVRAELLKVKVQLREVEVEEQKVELQRKQAELEVYLAQYEAQIAKAEADKQAMINVLNDLIAKAEIQSIRNAKALIDAEDQLENYLLTQERVKADSAKAYSRRYFAATDEIQKLQFQQIKAKAQKALVEAGALKVRDAIYDEIDKIDEQIEENEAIIAILKERQAMTPEEAKVAVAEAKLALEDAYTVRAFADSVEAYAKTNLATLKAKTADFFVGTYDGTKSFKHEFELLTTGTSFAWDKEDGVRGVTVLDEEGKATDEFIPLWTSGYWDTMKFAETKVTRQRYPDLDVYSGTESTTKDFVVLETTENTPLSLNFDNANKVLDAIAKFWTDKSAADVKKYEEETIPALIKEKNDSIDLIQDSLVLHTEYVNARKATIAAKEQAYIDELAANKAKQDAKLKAWNDWQEYMLVQHDSSRAIFTRQWAAQKAYDDAVTEFNLYEGRYNDALDNVASRKKAIKPAIENEAKAEGKYHEAKAKATSTSAQSSVAYKKWEGLDPYTADQAIKNTWNEKFDEAKDTINDAFDNSVWNAKMEGASLVKVAGTKAAPAQAKYVRALAKVENANKDVYDAQMIYWRHPEVAANKTAYDNAVHALAEAESELVIAEDEAEDTEGTYFTVKAQYELAIGTAEVEEAKKAWNPDFYGTEGMFDHAYTRTIETTPKDTTYAVKASAVELKSGKWQKKGVTPVVAAGTAQGALLDAINGFKLAQADTTWHQTITDPEDEDASVRDLYEIAKTAKETAENTLKACNKALIAVVKHVKESEVKPTDKIEDYLDDDAKALYEEYLAKKKAAEEVHKAWAELQMWYRFNPDVIDVENVEALDEQYDNQPAAQYSWKLSSYMVDYKAKMLGIDGKYYYIASTYPGEYSKVDDKDVFTSKSSLAYQIEKLQETIAGMPELVKAYKTTAAAALKTKLDDIEKVRTNLMSYKPHEAGYLDWIKEMASAEKSLNELKKAAFDADKKYNTAKNVYEGVKYIADGFVYVYVGEGVTGADEEGFMKLNINQAIKQLEGSNMDLRTIVGGLMQVVMLANDDDDDDDDDDDRYDSAPVNNALVRIPAVEAHATGFGFGHMSIAELTFAKELLQNALKYGKVALQYVLEAYDEEIAELDEKMEFWSILAEKYKAIMNIYLGIVDEAVVAEPVEEEGDEE